MGSVGDEELFMQTQPNYSTATQLHEGEGEGDDVYLELEKAITERKCRIIQKKEKLRLMVNEIQKQHEKLKLVLNEEKCLKKEIEEVSNQKNVRVQNLKKMQESIATLETTLCELNSKLFLEKAETKRKKDELDAIIKDAYDTWESYKEKYENFPLAKKLQNVMIEAKKVEIAKKIADMDIADFKRKTRLKHDIAEKRFHQSVVRLAENYKLYQEKIEEQKKLKKKIMDMKKLMADIKSGKTTNHQLGRPQVSARPGSRKEQHGVQSPSEIEKFRVPDVQVRSPPEIVQFSVPNMQVYSPPPSANESESSGGRKLFSWDNLLSSTGFLGFSKKTVEESVKSIPDQSVNQQTPARIVHNLRDESQKKESPYGDKIVGSSLNLKCLTRNLPSSQQKPEMNVGNKRAIGNITQSEVNVEERPPTKKSFNGTPQSTKCSDTGITKANPTGVSEKPCQIKKYQSNENSIIDEDKENTSMRTFSSLVGMKSYKHSLVGAKPTSTPSKSGATSQNLKYILALQGNKNKAYESQRKDAHEQAKTTQTASANNQTFPQRGQQKSYNEANLFQNTNTDQQNHQFEDIPILLEPGSPAPDLIPVEANAHHSSQGNISQTNSPINFNLSGGSGFMSPADVDEPTKSVYERMVIQEQEYPMLDYSQGSTMGTQKPASEERVVRSQYFADPHTLNTPPAVDYQSPIEPIFSPPLGTDYDNDPQSMKIIASPPPGNTGAVGESGQVSNTSAFSFTFGGASKSSSTSKFFLEFI